MATSYLWLLISSTSREKTWRVSLDIDWFHPTPCHEKSVVCVVMKICLIAFKKEELFVAFQLKRYFT